MEAPEFDHVVSVLSFAVACAALVLSERRSRAAASSARLAAISVEHAKKSVETAKEISATQLAASLLKESVSQEMRNHFKVLSAWQKKHRNDLDLAVKYWASVINNAPQTTRDEISYPPDTILEIKDVENARADVMGFLYRVERLYAVEAFSRKVLDALCPQARIPTVLEVVMPLEEAVSSSKEELHLQEQVFAMLRKLKRKRPIERDDDDGERETEES